MAYADPPTQTPGQIAASALWNTYVRDNFVSLGRDAILAHNIGTAGGLGERWYWLGITDEPTFAVATVSLSTLSGYPFVVGRPGTIDRLAFEVTTGGAAGAKGRVGIYSPVSATDLYPGALLIDGGEFDVSTTGVKAATVSQVLEPDVVYWAITNFGTSATTQCRRVTAGLTKLLGTGATLGAVMGMYLSIGSTYGALPSSFPAGATVINTGGPFLAAVRYSA